MPWSLRKKHSGTERTKQPHFRQEIEDIHLRNYDLDQAYDLQLVISKDGRTVFTRRYDAHPGWTESPPEQLPPDEYEVTVTLNGRTTEQEVVRIGDGPEHSVVVECGNGCVTITQGIY